GPTAALLQRAPARGAIRPLVEPLRRGAFGRGYGGRAVRREPGGIRQPAREARAVRPAGGRGLPLGEQRALTSRTDDLRNSTPTAPPGGRGFYWNGSTRGRSIGVSR